MSNERSLLWLSVTGLIALGLAFGQIGAISVAAAVAAFLVWQDTKNRKSFSP
jgi:hypothetical protein